MNQTNWGSHRNPVQLIKINAPFQPKLQFGRRFSAEDNNPKLAAADALNLPLSPRSPENHSIKDPLTVRQQTILSHRLPRSLQRELSTGMAPPKFQAKVFNGMESISVANQRYFIAEQLRAHHAVR